MSGLGLEEECRGDWAYSEVSRRAVADELPGLDRAKVGQYSELHPHAFESIAVE